MATVDSSGIAATSLPFGIEAGIFCPWPIDPALRLAPANQWFDGPIVMPHDVPGTRVMKGDVAVFKSLKHGETPQPTKKPVLVKTQRGQLQLISYEAYALSGLGEEPTAYCYSFSGNPNEKMSSAEAIATCTHYYEP